MKINEAFGEVQSSYIEWDGFFKDPNYSRTSNAVSWRDVGDLVISDPITLGDLRNLSEQRQFSFRVSDDGSLIQLGYRFDRNGDLTDARLAFYKSPAQEFTGDLTVEPSADVDLSEQISWLRLDFAKDAPVRVGHTPCHLHFSGFPAVRFAVFGVPSPSQFVEFVVSHFYTTDYTKARLSPEGIFDTYQKINTINRRATKAGVEPRELLLCLPHLATPGN
jgi:hypothetical protein